MPGFYRRPIADSPVAQGDLFDGVPIIGVATSPMYRAVEEGTGFRAEQVEPDQLSAETILIEQVALTRAIVISQSCDAVRAPQLMLAPVVAFELTDKSASSKWKKISHAATSLAETKYVYLPGNPHLTLQRSRANFGEAFTVPRILLEELARRGKRIASLGETATSYLQFRLAVMLTRVAQDDYAWPSADDIEIKIAYLREEIKEKEKKAEKKAKDAAAAEGAEKDDLNAAHQELLTELEMLNRELATAEAAKPTADQLAA